jgi:hypothetical protein
MEITPELELELIALKVQTALATLNAIERGIQAAKRKPPGECHSEGSSRT